MSGAKQEPLERRPNVPKFADVTKAWDQASEDHIHPLHKINVDEYWASGVAQAEHAAQYIPDDGVVVDFGCGNGRLTIPLIRMGFNVIAVDASPTMLQRLADNAKRSKLSVNAVVSDGLNLPELLSETQVDVIVARAVLIHHSHTDVERLVRSFGNVLDPGGVLVADWPVGRNHERRDWIDVTTWEPQRRETVAAAAGFALVEDSTPGVWEKV